MAAMVVTDLMVFQMAHQETSWSSIDRSYGLANRRRTLRKDDVSIDSGFQTDPGEESEVESPVLKKHLTELSQERHPNDCHIAAYSASLAPDVTSHHEAHGVEKVEQQNLLLKSNMKKLRKGQMYLRNRLRALSKAFEEDERRLSDLSIQIKIMQSDLEQRHFLDDLLHLLDGHLDRIQKRMWPFKLGRIVTPDHIEPNLIV